MITLILTYKCWDMIVSGYKKCEYRKYSPKWDKFLISVLDDYRPIIQFRRGYTSTSLYARISKYWFRIPYIDDSCNLNIWQNDWSWNPDFYDMALFIDSITFVTRDGINYTLAQYLTKYSIDDKSSDAYELLHKGEIDV